MWEREKRGDDFILSGSFYFITEEDRLWSEQLACISKLKVFFYSFSTALVTAERYSPPAPVYVKTEKRVPQAGGKCETRDKLS